MLIFRFKSQHVCTAENNFPQNEFSTKSESSSPTFLAIIDNMLNELNILEKDFQIDK